MKKSNGLKFVVAVMIAHTAGYLVSGEISYQLITKDLWEGPDPLLASYLRTPGDPGLWTFAMVWQIPAQLVRSLLMGLVLLPFRQPLMEWSFLKRAFFMAGLLFVFTHLAASAPSPANLEGAVYLKPEFVKQGFWIIQPEMVLYSLVGGFVFSKLTLRKAAAT